MTKIILFPSVSLYRSYKWTLLTYQSCFKHQIWAY